MRSLFLSILLAISTFNGFPITIINKNPGSLEKITLDATANLNSNWLDKGKKSLSIKGNLSKEDVHFIARFAKEQQICTLDFSKSSFREIGLGLFEGCDKLEQIRLPKSLKTIAKQAFKDCHSLQSIKLPNNVTSIGSEAFYNCTKLSVLSYKKKLSWIGKDAFLYCPLNKIKNRRNKHYTNVGKHIYAKNGTMVF